MNETRSNGCSGCHSEANPCIACTVQQCVHHCGTENHCSLDRILARKK